ncbi:unnamed protein product [Brachionus calyciflorus]|uniref:Uncharacterized protein n=1 Tax=Brachionus calyciflorus TaxID=104777 RepID=A0A814HFZ8_9BILA|nr:unnamed protein product [Brachionus calyciflorus]
MPIWECETHIANSTKQTIIACLEDSEKRPTDFVIEPGEYEKCKTKKGRITVSAYRERIGTKEKISATFSAHTSVIVQETKSDRIKIVPAKMGTIWTPTEDGTEERTYLDSAVETINAVNPLRWVFGK